MSAKGSAEQVRDRLRVAPGKPVVLRDEDADPKAWPGLLDGLTKKKARAELVGIGQRLTDVQERLWAQGQTQGRHRVVLLLQGTDTSGKDGVVKNVLGLLHPLGLRATSFGRPTEQELAHDFLWRFEQALPAPGGVVAWNRSAYEDVLVVRVHELVPESEWSTRYDRINAWEAALAADGVTVVKIFLHLSHAEQGERLLERIERADKHWKMNADDLKDRARWEDYRAAYTAVLERCSTEAAPWYRVPADRKWYRDWAVASILLETLEGLHLPWPERPDLDLPALRAELEASRA